MISGTTSEPKNLFGVITAEKTLSGSISGKSGLVGTVSVSVRDVPYCPHRDLDHDLSIL